MFRPLVGLLPLVVALCVPDHVGAQSSGSRGGMVEGQVPRQSLPQLDYELAQRFIMIDGSAEVRVEPDQIRVVLAVTNEAVTAEQCQAEIQATVTKLMTAWRELKIAPDKIVVDFIAVLPRYEWAFEQSGGQEVAMEKNVGYRMQTNVHLAVQDEALAQRAVASAFQLGITDIIAFDYWSTKLDTAKQSAQKLALEAARCKAEQLLFSQTNQPLPLVNLQESTHVITPDQLYHSFANSYEQELDRPLRRELPVVRAYRPQNTYYRGPQLAVDVQDTRLPMRPQISVVGQVRLYYESPAAKRPFDQQDD